MTIIHLIVDMAFCAHGYSKVLGLCLYKYFAPEDAMLTLPLEKATYIIVKAREFDVQVPPERLESGSNGIDDREVGILESTADNPTREELTAALQNLNEDELADVLALLWLGRGDYDKSEWRQYVKTARSRLNGNTVSFLMGTPMLGDLVEEGLSQLGYSIMDYEKGRL